MESGRTAPLPLDVWTTTMPAAGPEISSWLAEPGLLTDRLRQLGLGELRLKVVRQGLDLLSSEHRALFSNGTDNGFLREIELHCGMQPCVYAQTLVPDATLAHFPWLAELGDSPLGETMGVLDGIEREPFEFAELPAMHPLAARAQRDLAVAERETVVARRALVRLRGRPLLVQELFLPALCRRVRG
jgi:chorismate lyase